MANLTYAERLKLNKEEQDLQKADLSAKEGSLQIQSDILSVQREIAGTKSKLEAAKNEAPLNSGTLLDLASELADYENQLAVLEGFKSELFPA